MLTRNERSLKNTSVSKYSKQSAQTFRDYSVYVPISTMVLKADRFGRSIINSQSTGIHVFQDFLPG